MPSAGDASRGPMRVPLRLRRDRLDEPTNHHVDPHGVSRDGRMSRTLDQSERRAGQIGELFTDCVRADPIGRPVDDVHGAADGFRELLERLCGEKTRIQTGVGGGYQCLGVDVGRPRHHVLDLLGGVRLGEHLAEEVLAELVKAALQPMPSVVRLDAVRVLECRQPQPFAFGFQLRGGHAA